MPPFPTRQAYKATACLRRPAVPFPGSNGITRARPYAQMPPRRKIDDSEIEENFLKGSGPGGQKINKTSSAVQLRHLPTGLVVKSQATRSRSQNRDIARRLLSEKLEVLEQGEHSRVMIKKAVKSKKKASAEKKKRRKYRRLEEEKIALEEGEEMGEGEGKEGGHAGSNGDDGGGGGGSGSGSGTGGRQPRSTGKPTDSQ